MDSQVYKLLASVDKEKNVDSLKEAFKILDPENNLSKEKSTRDIENFSQNLYVECAEKAINFNEIVIAEKCIQIYFSLPMIANQFLPRAYLCQFELLAPKGTHQLENLDKSIPFLFKAIEFSQQNKRYNFLVYNASVIFWKYARAFLKVDFKRYLCVSLKKIITSLREIDDADYEWRAILERALVEAYIDNKQIEEAKSLAVELNKFIKKNLKNLYDEFFEFINKENLLPDEELKSISTSKWYLSAIYRMEKLKKSFNYSESNTKKSEPINIYKEKEAILAELEEIYKLILPSNNKKILNQDQEKETNHFLKSSLSSHSNSNKKEDIVEITKRQRLLLNLTHVCLIYGEVNLCSQIIGYLKEIDLVNDEFSLEIEFVECEQAIKELKHKQEKYSKNVVKLRNDCINKLHETLRNAQRSKNPHLIQLGSIMQWNLCLPLLQPGLRNQIRKPLQFVSECLEEIDSMEWLLRCQIHYELAKCDEEIEQLQTAEQHLLKAIQLDDGNIYKEQLNFSLKRLRLRGELYKTPERIEDQSAMILEQCVVGGKPGNEKKLKPAIGELLAALNNQKSNGDLSSSNGEINTHSLLLRAADLIAQNEFIYVLESETFKSTFGKLNEDQVTRLNKKLLNYENCVKKCANHLNNRITEFERSFRKKAESAYSGGSSITQQNIKSIDVINSQILSNITNPNMLIELENVIKYDFKERLKLWFDLCRISRKNQIWDICRTSARFCMLYDNDQLINRFLKDKETNKFNSLFDVELMRNLAEAHFIFGEALIQYIRDEGVELFEKPKIPESEETSKENPANQQKQDSSKRDFSTDKEWQAYCDWLMKLSKEAIDHFLRGIQIGVQLNESYIVSQGSTYAWNYLNHIIKQRKNKQITHILNEILDALKKVGHNTEPELLVAICVAQAKGLMMPWLPEETVKSLQVPIVVDSNTAQVDKTQKKDNKPNTTVAPVKTFSVPPESSNDLKKALEIVDYAMTVTNGENLADIVSLKDRFPLIKTWVLAKQVNQSSIKNFGLTKSSSSVERIQDKYTKCLVGIQILQRNYLTPGTVYDIKDAPTIKELINLTDQIVSWPDRLVELEIWSNLAVLAGKAGQTENLRVSHSKALETISYFEKKKHENKKVYILSQYLLSIACIALGEHLASLLNSPNLPTNTSKTSQKESKDQQSSSSASISMNMNKDVRVAMRRDALNAFSDAVLYASTAENYEYVIHAARHYWNLCLPYLQQPQERATLYENISEILKGLQNVYKFKPMELPAPLPVENIEPAKEADTKTKKGGDSKAKKGVESAIGNKAKSPIKHESVEMALNENSNTEQGFNQIEDAFDDLTLRCVFYACLFQITIDRQDYEEALEQMENALNEMPRTKHRLLIYRFKVITKSKLGLDVQMDLQKFREESEKNLAQMYRKVGLSSIKHVDTINSYQRAIEALNSEESLWLKFEYIIELAQWMYSHEYELNDCIDLCDWAIDLIMFSVNKNEKTSRSVSVMSDKIGKTKKSIKPIANVLPTIEDGVEVNVFQKKIEKNVEEEFESLTKTANKDTLFEFHHINKALNWNDFVDIKQLDCLIRSHTILAKMSGRTSLDYTNNLFKAFYTVKRLVNQAIENAYASLKDIQKAQAQALADNLANDKKKTQNQADPKKADTAGKTNAAQKKFQMPQTLEQWSLFELPEEISSAWQHELMRKTGINHYTIVEPYILFYYLDILANMLADLGFSQFLFEIYNLQLLLVNSAIKFDDSSNIQLYSLNSYVRLKLINLCVELNMISSINFHQQALATLILSSKPAGTTTVNPEAIAQSLNMASSAIAASPSIMLKLVQIDATEVCFVREQIYNQKQRLSQLANEEALNSTSFASLDGSSQKSSTSDKYYNVSTKAKKKSMHKNLLSVKIHEIQKKTQQSEFNASDLKLPGEQRKINDSSLETLYKDIWILIADKLVENGYFQTARDFIYESLNACIEFEDSYTLSKIHYLLGKIALYDCNFIEARNYASSAQKLGIDEIFWYKCIRLLIDSYKLDRQDKEAYDKSVKLLKKSLDIIEMEKERRKNKSDSLSYIFAMLNYELAEITYEGHINDKFVEAELTHKTSSNKRFSKKNSMHPNLFKKLSQVCNMYQLSIETLLSNGYKREAVTILKSHAKILTQFANDCHNLEAKKDYLLQTLTVLNDASNILNEMWTEVVSTMPSSTFLQNISLPLQRELVDLKLEISKLLTNMLEVHLGEILVINEKNMKKNQLVKALENYVFVQGKPLLNETESLWRSTISKLPDILTLNLICAHNLSYKNKYLRAPTLYLLGRTLRLLTDLKFQVRKINLNDDEESNSFCARLNPTMSISKWSTIINDLIKSQVLANDDAKSTKTKKSAIESTSFMPHTEIIDGKPSDGTSMEQIDDHISIANLTDITSLKNLLVSLNQHEAQSAECLFQALNLAFTIEDKHLIRNITFELIELLGRFDSHLTSQLIAMYQSCSNAIDIESILEKSSLDPKNSLLTGFYHQMNFLKNNNLRSNILNSPVVKQLLDATKSSFNAFKYLNINSFHFNLQQNLPNHYTVLIIQHNQHKNELFTTILGKSSSGLGGGMAQAGGKGAKVPANTITGGNSGGKPLILKVKTDPFELNHLQQQWREWKVNLQQFNLKLEFQLNNDSKKTVPNQNQVSFLNSSFHISDLMLKYYLSPSSSKFEELTDCLQDLDSKFLYLINKTENYLKKVTEFFQSYFNLQSENNTPLHPNITRPTEKIVLLADLDLLEFPLECLKVFHQNQSILSITRDFSLQFFSTRYIQQKESELNSKVDDNKKDNKNAKPAAAVATDKKQTTQIVAQNEPLPDNAVVIDHTRLKYLIDPFNEASNSLPPDYTPIGLLKKITQQYNQHTIKWSGLVGGDNYPSLGERERALLESNCFIFNGTERFLSYFNTNKIASLNLNECKLIIANDLAQTAKSYSRLGKIDVDRDPGELECENHLEANILLSLCGVKCIMSNQWTSSLAENCEKFSNIIKEFIENRQSCGEIIRFRVSPHIKHMLIEANKKEEENKIIAAEKEQNKKDGKQKEGGKKDTVAVKDDKKSKSPTKNSEPQTKSPTRSKSPSKKHHEIAEDAFDNQREIEEENKQILLQKLSQLAKENCNMVCYGLPDVFMSA